MAEPRHKLEGYMEFQKCTMDAFSVIGKEGASQEGEGFVQKLWQDTNLSLIHISCLECLGRAPSDWAHRRAVP